MPVYERALSLSDHHQQQHKNDILPEGEKTNKKIDQADENIEVN
jgi:hypothetical protein